jgi:LPS export ABC transporter protein LptC
MRHRDRASVAFGSLGEAPLRKSARVWTGSTRLGVLLCVAWALGCTREEPQTTQSAIESPRRIIRDFVTTETDSDQTRYVFHATVARVYQDNVTRADTIHVEFYERGKRVSVLTAREGVLQSGRLTARGDVVVTAENGSKLVTESLYWDNDIEKIRSDDFVRITRPGESEVLQGYGLTSDPNLDLVEIGPFEYEQDAVPENQ